MLIVPVLLLQVGCVMEIMGAVGIPGAGFTTADVAGDMHPPVFLTVTLYVPELTPEKTLFA